MTKTKILVLHTSVGFGIKATAENVVEQLNISDKFEVRITDIEKAESGMATSAVRNVYLALLDKISSLWGFLYNSKIVMWITLPCRKFIFSFKSKNILQILREFQPAVVISTLTVPTG